MSDALNLEPGALVGGYTLMSRLGSGAMGSVWRVHDDGGEEYAMKIFAIRSPMTVRRRPRAIRSRHVSGCAERRWR